VCGEVPLPAESFLATVALRSNHTPEEATMAADPAQVASNVYTTLFENDRVRLLEARIAPGDSSVMHGHPDYVVYNLADGRVRFSSPSGETEEV
jgi:hypothetical protein